MRIPFIAANWKMHKTVHESVVFVKEFRSMVKDIEDVEIVVAPPFTAVHAVAEAARNSNVGVAGQNLHWERQGAFTGEVSAEMVRESGAEYVIIGHSERRRLFGDTDELVNRRLIAALGAKLTPIVCIGETLEEREGSQTLAVLDRQLKVGLDSMTGEQIASLVIAYEPVWAIGTGRTPTLAEIQAMHAAIREALAARYGAEAAEVRILYGGSVKPENASEILAIANVDGALIGGASLKAADFLRIARAAPRR